MSSVLQLYSKTNQLGLSGTLFRLDFVTPVELYSKTLNLGLSGSNPNMGNITAIHDYVAGAFTGVHALFQSGTAVQFDIVTMDSASFLAPYWQGSMTQMGMVNMALPEAHNHDPISTLDNPQNSLEGGNTVEWDIFPIVPTVPAPPGRDRDLTRYHKAYSFTRPQPVRIRLFRR